MNLVTEKDIHDFGRNAHGSDYFDDSKDLQAVVNMAKTSSRFRNWILNITLLKTNAKMTRENFKNNLIWRRHPYGPKDIDFSLVNKLNKLPVALIEVEHMTKMNPDFPKYYAYLSFLDRKKKYVENAEERGIPFFMIYVNHLRNKLIAILITQQILDSTNVVEKEFSSSQLVDRVWQLPTTEAYVFADNDAYDNISQSERNRFRLK